VKFQQVVVHSVENWEADVVEAKADQETEWTITIMLDRRFMVERNLQGVLWRAG